MAPPSAALEHGTFGVAGGVKPFTSAAGDTNIPQSLVLTCFAAFVVYNLAFIFDIDLLAIINFGTTVYHTIIKWIGIIRQKGPRATVLAIASSFGNWVKDTYRSHMYAHAFHTGLEHMTSNPSEHLGRTIFVDTIIVPGAGSLALIRGLPSDVSAPELRQYLESILFVQYRNGGQDINRVVIQSESDDTEDAPIDTSCPGLWNGTCVRPREDTIDTPSTSGINTPTSNTSASSTPTIDCGIGSSAPGTESLELEDLSPP
ncbi:hypothetical protein E8E11_000725 [Didymella keratinophila]|nr:hypothetical protein E8E11_000725 [Didymella keratinophila]